MQRIIPSQGFPRCCLRGQGRGTDEGCTEWYHFLELFLGKSYPPNPLIISCLIITDSSPKYIHREKLSGFGAGEMQGDWGGGREEGTVATGRSVGT